MRTIQSGTMAAVLAMTITSCQFGDVEDVRPKDYALVEREFTITLDAMSPGNTDNASTRTQITDQHTYGLDIEWIASDEIALFGNGVQTEDGSVICLSQPEETEESDLVGGTTIDDNISWASFSAKNRMKIGNTNESLKFAFTFPYKKFMYESPSATQVNLNFNGQDGTLGHLQNEYHYAWGLADGTIKGNSSEGELTFEDAMGGMCNAPDAHNNHSDYDHHEGVVLDNKMSVIRFSLVHQKTNGTLESFQKFIGSDEITSIVLHDDNNSMYNTATLNLSNGVVTGVDKGSITIRNNSSSLNLIEITQDDELSSNGNSWGTTFYLSLPVPDNEARYKCWLEIRVGNDSYYVYMTERTFTEGRYYLTKPLVCYNDKSMAMLNPIEIMLDYEATQDYILEGETMVVWDTYGAPLVWDRYGLYYLPYYLFENLKPGVIMTVDFSLLSPDHGDLHIRDGKGYQGGGDLPIHTSVEQPNRFESDGTISITSLKNAGVINWTSGTQVSFVLTQEILDAIRSRQNHGCGITFAGDGDYKQTLNRVTISNLSEDELPGTPEYGTWFVPGQNGHSGYMDSNSQFDFDSYLLHPICYTHEGDLMRIHYTDCTLNKLYIGPNGGDVFTNGQKMYEFTMDNNNSSGYIDLPIDNTVRYMSAYHEGLRLRANYNGVNPWGTSIKITEIEIIRQ